MPIYILLIILSSFAIISVVFVERKKPSEIISWIFVISFLPVLGVLLYLLIGETASMKISSRFGRKRLLDDDWRKHWGTITAEGGITGSGRLDAARLDDAKQHGIRQDGARHDGDRQDGDRQDGARHDGGRLDAARLDDAKQHGIRQDGARHDGDRQDGGAGTNDYNNNAVKDHSDIIGMIVRQSFSNIARDNKIDIYTNANDKYAALYEDIKNARTSVHMLYFTFNADYVGNGFIDLLEQKAKEGVEVRLLYDAIGNIPYTITSFDRLVQAGGKVSRFFPLINVFKVNYRNHRKIVVIDGRIAYTGGINISKSYIGGHARAKPWRDTHIRLTGSSVGALQERFLLDWIFVSHEPLDFDDAATRHAYFPGVRDEDAGAVAAQVVSSGPDVEGEHIKYGYIKMINNAKHSLYMQSPYFIPDDAFMLALRLAVDSGVDVRIILPGIPDKRAVYIISQSYLAELLKAGVKVYLYNGFIHSKMIVMDGEVTSIGTANIDIRSFLLDFEINTFIYDAGFSGRCVDIFMNDIENSSEMTPEHATHGIFRRLLETVLRILAPLL